MQKILRFVSASALALVLSTQINFGQTTPEAQAGMRDEATIFDLPTPATPEKPVVEEKKEKALPVANVETPVQAFQKQFQAQHPKMAKKMEKAERFLNSKVGKWVIKRAMAKAERKALRQAKKHPELAAVSPDKLKEAKKLSGNLRIAAILAIVGVILTLLGENILTTIGLILIVIALVLLLIELI